MRFGPARMEMRFSPAGIEMVTSPAGIEMVTSPARMEMRSGHARMERAGSAFASLPAPRCEHSRPFPEPVPGTALVLLRAGTSSRSTGRAACAQAQQLWILSWL